MKLNFLFLIIVFQLAAAIHTYAEDKKLLDIIMDACKDIDVTNLDKKYTDSIQTTKLDFTELLERRNIAQIPKSNNEHYTVFYSDNKIKKVTKYNTKQKKKVFTIFFAENSDIYVGVVLYYYPETVFYGSFTDGVMLIDTKMNLINYIYIPEIVKTEYRADSLLLHPPSPKEVTREFSIRQDLNSKSIWYALALDEHLNPKTRLNFRNGRLLSFSRVIPDIKGYKEELDVYDIHKSEQVDNLDMYYLRLLLRRGGSTDVILACTVIPDLNKDFPFWLYLDFEYK